MEKVHGRKSEEENRTISRILLCMYMYVMYVSLSCNVYHGMVCCLSPMTLAGHAKRRGWAQTQAQQSYSTVYSYILFSIWEFTRRMGRQTTGGVGVGFGLRHCV